MKHVLLALSLVLLPLSSALAQAPAPPATPAASPTAPAAPAPSYGCPMHPDVASDKPGKCSKCGMALVEKRPAPAPAASTQPASPTSAAASAAAFGCPMHPDVTSDKPGKCSKCGMALAESGKVGKAPMKHEHTPHHGGQLGMVGENHVEIVIPKAGEYVVWLSDAYRKPLALGKAAGALTVTDASGKIVNAPLALSPKKDSLVATTPAMTGTLNVHVAITGVAAAVIDTEFQFEVK
jgi:hypothetical protein